MEKTRIEIIKRFQEIDRGHIGLKRLVLLMGIKFHIAACQSVILGGSRAERCLRLCGIRVEL